jgi:hypothetical protein
MQAVKGLAMEKWLCWGALGVTGLILLFFILDMPLGWPFGGLSKTADVLGILASAILIYFCYETARELP